ncbi:hypothetical protein A2W14_04170 [Candidatus Gottesmanbacteria bacterium RBG_16_37_8]|uniref:Abasic site processing protein n=1 Tax=Candidatus Gottesmanbacteria bacterium RBG_16_37_8 TaxID=1798371 RepID=A0A1F5YPU1_9BACT|nr:MAG: hypothetical protein A2W14_04170 [Candidatus Gottesmanbacteria bacterium RBG_16_37_8]
MCGRYGFTPGENFYKRFEVTNRLDKLQTHYNVTPGMQMPVIVRVHPGGELFTPRVELMKWGLIPFWSKDPRIGYKMINARAEGIEDKPSFRKPLRSQRCLVPTSFFFEWRHMGEEKIPYLIKLKGEDVFAMAGLYDIWKDAEGYSVKSFTIITTEPNTLLGEIHNRMPVILHEKFEDTWLNPQVNDVGVLLNFLKPYDAERMEAFPVSKLVNNPANDSQEIISKTGS